MHKILRYIRQNTRQIIKVALFVAFLILLIPLLNSITTKSTESKEERKKELYEKSNGTIISNKSSVTGGAISNTTMEKVNKIIEEFVKLCNDKNIEGAYNLISDECKEELYPNLESFKEQYYEPLFKNEKRTYTIENWMEDTYVVKFTRDLLATGKSAKDFSYQDYITIVEEDNKIKLNINKYVGKEEINKEYDSDEIEAVVLCKEIYMDYEIYEMKITNKTGNTILMDQLTKTDSIYLEDTNGTKHSAYSNEIVKDNLQIYNGHTNDLKIKFNSPYIEGRKTDKICFSEVVLNYSPKNNAAYSLREFFINI